jgi:hypothetical protein
MPPKKRPASRELSRLTVLAAGDDRAAFGAYALELLASRDRLAREAALEALLDRPVAGTRDALRELYFELDGQRDKLDAGAHLRTAVARLLLAGEDARDVDIGLRAADTYEKSMGVDSTANLRSLGLKIIAAADPDLFPYVAAEHIDDSSTFSPEPANTALQLLAGTGHQLSVYQWIVSGPHDADLVEAALGLLDEAPAIVMSRCLAQLTRDAIEKKDETLLTKLAETIVERALEDAYASLSSILQSGISKELYSYLALLLAGTNRPTLLAVLEEQLEQDILRRPAILDALRVRTTPEQAAILRRWEDGGEAD